MVIHGNDSHLHMMAMPMEQLEERANRLNDMLSTIKDVNCCVVQVNSAPGGGSLPGQQLPSFGVSVEVGSMSEVELERRLPPAGHTHHIAHSGEQGYLGCAHTAGRRFSGHF